MSEELKPCPFCGASLIAHDDQNDMYVRRYGTHYRHPYSLCYLADTEVTPSMIEEWNTRSTPKHGEAAGWQPIETAPKDGSSFLSLNRNQGNLMAATWWSPVRNYFCATGGQQLYQFTHWMPLPAAPKP